jgi:hypothetical protein
VYFLGIFRISASKDEVTLLKRQVETGDYELKIDNPHAPACLLKEWYVLVMRTRPIPRPDPLM